METQKCSICDRTRPCVELNISEGMLGTNIGFICPDCIVKITNKDATDVTWFKLANFVKALDYIKNKGGESDG